MRTFVIAMFSLSTVISVTGFASDDDRTSSLQRIKRGCEKNIRVPKILRERIAFCECIRRNHAAASKTDELPLIERIYSKSVKAEEKASVNESIIADFDLELAGKCLENSDYKVPESMINKSK